MNSPLNVWREIILENTVEYETEIMIYFIEPIVTTAFITAFIKSTGERVKNVKQFRKIYQNSNGSYVNIRGKRIYID